MDRRQRFTTMTTRTLQRSGAAPFSFALLAAAALALSGCVTETTKSRPKGLTRAAEPATTRSDDGATTSTRTPMPDGPVAKRAESAQITDARVTVALRPVGQVPYDGMTLPLISPGGRYLATQSGASPTWEAVLAQPGSFVAASTRIGAFEIPGDSELSGALKSDDDDPRKANKGGAVRPISWPKALPSGVLLGRSCDDRGFLIESPRPDGARWIGKVSWVSGAVDWLVQDSAVNAFATFGPRGELIFCRRTVASGPDGAFELVIRPNAGSSAGEAVARGLSRRESYAYPLCGSDGGHVYAFAYPTSGEGSLTIVALALSGTGEARPGTIVARDGMNVEGTLFAACQTAAPMQTPWPPVPAPGDRGDGNITKLWTGVAAISASTRSVVFFSPETGVSALSQGSMAAVPLVVSTKSGDATLGLLLATERELVYQQMRSGDSAAPGTGLGIWSNEAAVLAGAYIPRVIRPGPAQGAPGVDNLNGGNRGIRYVLMNPARDVKSQILGVSIMVPIAPDANSQDSDR